MTAVAIVKRVDEFAEDLVVAVRVVAPAVVDGVIPAPFKLLLGMNLSTTAPILAVSSASIPQIANISFSLVYFWPITAAQVWQPFCFRLTC